MRRPERVLVHALFFLSGMSGLVYEVAWVRQLGNALGNTVHSASLVTAAYMCGLGAGAHLAGGWSDRRARSNPRAPLRAYAVAELSIAALGLGLAVLLPHLSDLSAWASAYARGTHGWFEPSLRSMALRYGVAAVLLLPPTLLMGATFTLLVRFVMSHEVRDAGWRVGALYGVNTAGAAAGALLTDLALVPAVGLFRAQLGAVLLQVAVGVVALGVAMRDDAAPRTSLAEVPEAGAPGRTLGAACFALFLSGCAALGMEIVWFRSLSCSLGAFRPVFSMVLFTILAGIWLGSTAGGHAHRRYGKPLELFVVSQAMFVVVALLLMATFTTRTTQPVLKDALDSTLRVVFVPALLMGFSMPLANAVVQDRLGQVGRRAGALYLANTVGSVAGSLVAGFLLADRLSSQQSFAVFAACAVLAPMPLVLASAPWPRSLRICLLASAALVVPAFSAWLALPANYLVASFFPLLPAQDHVLAIGEGSNEIIVVADDVKGARWLITNGHPMSANSLAAQRYMRAFSHIPLVMMDHPKSALVICFGVGNTLHAASLHSSLERIEVADLSRNVLEHASYFRSSNHDVLHDPRVLVFVDDGRQHLRAQAPDTYDLITLEPPPISFAGVSALYSREFYELARSRLKPGGYMTQWLPAYQVPPQTGLQMVRAFIDVFPNAVLLSGEGAELILMGTRRPELLLDLDRVEANLRDEPAVAADLMRVRLGTLTEIAGMFVAGADALRHATAGVVPVTDDLPSMEYTFLRPAEAPASLFALEGLGAFCPACFDGGKAAARVAPLGTYVEALRRIYATQPFRQHTGTVVIDTTGGVGDAIRGDAYLRSLLGVEEAAPSLEALRERAQRDSGNPQAHFALAYALGKKGFLEEALVEQRRGVELAPGDADAHYNLAAIEASAEHEDLAIREAEKAVALDPDQPRANAMLCAIFRAHDDPRAEGPCRRTRGR